MCYLFCNDQLLSSSYFSHKTRQTIDCLFSLQDTNSTDVDQCSVPQVDQEVWNLVTPEVSQTDSTDNCDTPISSAHHSKNWYPDVTSDSIAAPPLTQERPSGKMISKRALKALASKRVHATIAKDNPDYVFVNEHLGNTSAKNEHNRQFNLEQLLHHHENTEVYLASTPYFILPDVKTLQFLSFKLHPSLWLNTDQDKSVEETDNEKDGVDMAQDMFNPYLGYMTSNTSQIEQDTNFPDIRKSNQLNGVKTVCVIVGDPNVIATELDTTKSYAEASDNTFRKIYGIKSDVDVDDAKLKRSNDFPILAGLNTKSTVYWNNKEYEIDFVQKTESMGTCVIPLLLTSPTELSQRLQLQFFDCLYGMGEVKLCPTPLDKAGKMYCLNDEDNLSQVMNFTRSDTVIYQVRISCMVCSRDHHNLFVPNSVEEVARAVSDNVCSECRNALQDRSGFVMREANCRQSLDPGCARKITYEVPIVSKTPQLPTDVHDVADLQPFEMVSHLAGPSTLALDIQKDVYRKNQKNVALSVTMYVPTTFSKQETLKSVKTQLEGTGFELTELPSEKHVVEAYVYHEQKEKVINLVATRVKISHTCNKVAKMAMSETNAEVLKTKLGSLKECVEVQPLPKPVLVHVPSVQTCKRIGVQTVTEKGDAYVHHSPVIVTPKNRSSGKRQPRQSLQEEGSMMAVQAFWCKPDYNGEDNFTCHKRSLVACFISNIYRQGIIHLSQDIKVELLPRGCNMWMKLDGIFYYIHPEINHRLLTKASKEVVKQIESKDRQIKVLSRELEQAKCELGVKEIDGLRAKVVSLTDDLKKVTKERDELSVKNYELEHELRIIKRECVKIQERHDQLSVEIGCLRSENEDVRAKCDSLEEGMKAVQSMEERIKMLEERGAGIDERVGNDQNVNQTNILNEKDLQSDKVMSMDESVENLFPGYQEGWPGSVDQEWLIRLLNTEQFESFFDNCL